jgi:hypothetical protein
LHQVLSFLQFIFFLVMNFHFFGQGEDSVMRRKHIFSFFVLFPISKFFSVFSYTETWKQATVLVPEIFLSDQLYTIFLSTANVQNQIQQCHAGVLKMSFPIFCLPELSSDYGLC